MTTPRILRRLAPSPTSLWRNRDFNLLWGSQALSGLGSSMSSLAYPLLVLFLTHNAVIAGAVGTVSLLVRVVVRIPAGVLVDRVDRRRLMLGCDLIRLVALGVLGISLVLGLGSIWIIFAVVAVEGVMSSTFEGAAMAAVRNVVPLEQVAIATARDEARSYAVSLIGPPAGGGLFAVGRALPFLADAVSYVLSLIGLLMIRRPLQERAAGKRSDTSPVRDLVEGLRFTLASPFLRSSMMIAAPLNMSVSGIMFGIVVLLQQHGTPAALIGTVETVVGIGGLLGAVAASALLSRFSMSTLIRGITIAGIPLLLAVLPLSRSPLAAVPMGLLVLLAPALNASLFGHLVAITPDRLQGRVSSALITAAMSLAAFAPVVAGALISHFGARGLVIGFTAIFAVSTVAALSSRSIRVLGPAGSTVPDPEGSS